MMVYDVGYIALYWEEDGGEGDARRVAPALAALWPDHASIMERVAVMTGAWQRPRSALGERSGRAHLWQSRRHLTICCASPTTFACLEMP